MEKESWRRNHEEESWRRNREEESLRRIMRRSHGGGILDTEEHWKTSIVVGIWEAPRKHRVSIYQGSLRGNHGGGIMGKGTWRRNHGGGIMEEL